MGGLSFRWRMALLAAAVAGLVLVAFSATVWAYVYRDGLRSVDQELQSRIMPHLALPPWSREHWERFEESLQRGPAAEEAVGYRLLVLGPEREVAFQSEGWPESWSVAEYPAAPPGPSSPPPAQPGQGLGPPPRAPDPGRIPPQAGPGPGGPRPGGGRGGPPPAEGEARPLPPRAPSGPAGEPPRRPPEFHTVTEGGERWRQVVVAGPRSTLVLAANLDPFEAQLGRLGGALALGIPLALLLIAGGSWLLGGRALQPIRKLATAAEKVTAQSLNRRLALGESDPEFQRVLKVFNAMLGRLEASFQQTSRFSADAAHELKTPLTILQGELEQALQGAAVGSEEQQRYNRLLEEVQRLKSIVAKLLLLARVDAGSLEPEYEEVGLTELLEELVEDTRAMAGEIKVEERLEPGVRVQADRQLVQTVLHNLLSNAVKYNRPEGRVEVTLRQDGESVEVSVTNTGPGIAPQDRERVFDRLYRGDPARSRQVDGVGLGLSLARQLVRVHGGSLQLTESRPDWTTFTMRLPRKGKGGRY